MSSLSPRASPVTWTSQPCPRSRRGNPPAVCVALFQAFRTGRRDQARDTQTPGAGGREHGCPGACVTPWLPFLLPLARSGAGENYLQWGFTCCFCCGLAPSPASRRGQKDPTVTTWPRPPPAGAPAHLRSWVWADSSGSGGSTGSGVGCYVQARVVLVPFELPFFSATGKWA